MDKAYSRINWENKPSIATPIDEDNLNRGDNALNIIDDRVISLDLTKANQSDLLQTVRGITYNTNTGVFVFTWWDNTTLTVDLNIEKIPVSFSMSDAGIITMTTADGTEFTADVSNLIKTYSFADSSEIDFTVTTDTDGNKTVIASIKDGSITGNKLQPNYLADVAKQANNAASSASAAADSASDANNDAKLAQSYAVGTGGVIRDNDTTDNAKYYKEQAALQAASASTSASNASNSADTANSAKEIVLTAKQDIDTIKSDIDDINTNINTKAGQVAQDALTASTNAQAAIDAASDVADSAAEASGYADDAKTAKTAAETAQTAAEEAAQHAEEVSHVDIMTLSKNGIGKPDGTTIIVNANGTFSAVSKSHFIVVPTLPAIASAQEDAIYLVKDDTATGEDKYREYIVVEENGVKKWAIIGDTSIDLSNYVKSDVTDALAQDISDLNDELTQELTTINTALQTHENKSVVSQTGVHGVRYYNGKFQGWDVEKEEWFDIATGGGGSDIQLSDVTGANSTTSGTSVSLIWTDPSDVEISGVTLARWKGTLVVRKQESAPTSRTDGTVVVNSITRNEYSSTPFVDTGLSYGTTYYYRFFPYTTGNTYTDGSSVSATPARVDITTIPSQSGTLTYNTSSQNPSWSNYSTTSLTIGGDIDGTNAGTYTATFTPKEGYQWSSSIQSSQSVGATDPISVSWSISKASGNATLSATSVTLNSSNTSATVTVSNATGAIGTPTTSNSSIATASLSGSIITISNVNNTSGSATITIPIAASDNYNTVNKTVSVSAVFSRTMSVTLDFTNSDPTTWATYGDDAVGMTAGSTDWDDFFKWVPGYLMFEAWSISDAGVSYSKGDFQSAINISSSGEKAKYEMVVPWKSDCPSHGDVMMRYPRMGIKISGNTSSVTISMTDTPNASGYNYDAHTYKGIACDYFYLGCNAGYEESGKLRSKSGVTPTTNKTIGAFRTLAEANGSGYGMWSYPQLTFLQCAYLLKYKGQNAQSAIGRGFVDGNNAVTTTSQSFINSSQMLDYGETTGKDHMSFAGIQDFYGNVFNWIDGVFSNANRQLTVIDNSSSNATYNDTGSGYKIVDSTTFSSNIYGYMRYPACTNSGATDKAAAGFAIGTNSYGSSTTYFCDSANRYASRLAYFGGSWNDGDDAGVFQLYVDNSAANAYSFLGARLMYLPPA